MASKAGRARGLWLLEYAAPGPLYLYNRTPVPDGAGTRVRSPRVIRTGRAHDGRPMRTALAFARLGTVVARASVSIVLVACPWPPGEEVPWHQRRAIEVDGVGKYGSWASIGGSGRAVRSVRSASRRVRADRRRRADPGCIGVKLERIGDALTPRLANAWPRIRRAAEKDAARGAPMLPGEDTR